VFRHLDQRPGRLTAIVDFLADPDDRQVLLALLRGIEREARSAGSDKIRAFVMNQTFQNVLRSMGYFRVKSSVELVVKVNAVPVGAGFYRDTSRWHITIGDSDLDR
jgi:hypothetical protein